MTSWVYIDVQGACQFSPRRKLTWCEGMSIFAWAKIDMMRGHVNFRLGENWHGARPCQFSPSRENQHGARPCQFLPGRKLPWRGSCQFSPRRKLTCPWEFVGSILTVHLNFLGSGAKFSIYKMFFFYLKTLFRENLYGNLATNNTHFKAPGWIHSHVNFNPGLNRKLPASLYKQSF